MPIGVEEFLPPNFMLRWQMTCGEKLALLSLLQRRKARISIEVGTSGGGSLQALAAHSQVVYSLDIDPTTPQRLAEHFNNVTFITGDSAKTLPRLLWELREAGQACEFALIDGEHTADGARRDIRAFLTDGPPLEKLWMVMHDASNETVRQGITHAGWRDCPHVQFVDFDFVQGWEQTEGDYQGKAQMWGGFAVAVLTPDVRQEPLNIRKGQEDFLRRVHRRQPTATVHLNPVRRTLRAVRDAVSGRASEARQP